MTGAQIIMRTVGQIPENELIFASRLYAEYLHELVSEEAYYQTLGRMCKAGTLCRIARGTYYRPKASKYGMVPPSQKEIVAAFTEPDKGTVVGYSLYNSLNLTTQVPKTVEVFSSQIEQQTKNISNVFLQFCNLVYTPEVKSMIHMLEVLQNFSEIQDLNYHQFIRFCEKFAQEYDGKAFEQVIQNVRYQKKTISFLRNILNHYGVKNDLNKYLSALSEYKHPTMEEIYETAYLS
ncbi:MAG: hypothetical protein IJO79_04150 [Firmicutes bacterium]|nr:hypothetical protein [Bacillota bacterium]